MLPLVFVDAILVSMRGILQISQPLKPAAVLLSVAFLLSACSGPQTVLPSEIEPVYRIRNTPLPVPDPHWKPITQRSGAVSKPVHKASNAPVRDSSKRTVTGKQHTVQRGDTLYALSKRYKVPVRALISNNNLRAPYRLKVGQRLHVPVPRVHRVKKGETSYGISRQYGVTVSALMKINDIKPPYRLSVGQNLRLPGGAGAKTADRRTASKRAIASNSVSRANKQSKWAKQKKPGRVTALPKPPPRSRAGFQWPVSGKLASRFGPREGGLHNDGINIIAPKGTAVKVADAGVVVYASNALEGYGNLLLVKHAGGWITAYAHAERLLVRPGQKLKRGAVVARVGSTGGVASPQLHFEIRKGRQALDPLRYLPTLRAQSSR